MPFKKWQKPRNTWIKMSEKHRKKLSDSHKWLLGNFTWKKHTEESKEKNRQAHLGKNLWNTNWFKVWKSPWNKWLKGFGGFNKWKKASEETKKKLSEKRKQRIISEETRRKTSESMKWSKCHFWKWWIDPENRKARKGVDMQLRKETVFKRDNRTCQKCNTSWWRLNAHHIHNFADYPLLRTSIENWITLCKPCHQLFHKRYWKSNNTKDQLEEYLK